MELTVKNNNYIKVPTEDEELIEQESTNVKNSKSEHPIMDSIDKVCEFIGLASLYSSLGLISIGVGVIAVIFSISLTILALPFSLRSSIKEKKIVFHVVTCLACGTIKIDRNKISYEDFH